MMSGSFVPPRYGVYVIWPSVKRPGDPLARSKKAFVNWPSSTKAA